MDAKSWGPTTKRGNRYKMPNNDDHDSKRMAEINGRKIAKTIGGNFVLGAATQRRKGASPSRLFIPQF
jgi:hypothetical protein